MAQQAVALQRPDLGALVKGFDLEANANRYVAARIMPIFDTPEQFGAFPKINKEELLKYVSTRRTPRSGYERIWQSFEQDSYACKEYGVEGLVDHTYSRAYGSYLRAEAEVAAIVMDNIAHDYEKRVAAIVGAQSGTGAGAAWDTAGASPKEEIHTHMETVRKRTGVKPNSLQITEYQANSIIRTTEFLETTKYTGNPLALDELARNNLIRDYLNVPNLIIASAVENTADEGQTFAGGDIWSDDEAFLFIASNQLQGPPKFGLTMRWASDSLMGVESYEEDQTRSTVIRAYNHCDEKVVLAEAGFRITGLQT